MASQGGSIVVEQRLRAQGTFRVHWAGGPTSDAGADCGSDAALVVDGSDLRLLTNVVGGAGVEHKPFLTCEPPREACQPLTKQQAVDPGSVLRR